MDAKSPFLPGSVTNDIIPQKPSHLKQHGDGSKFKRADVQRWINTVGASDDISPSTWTSELCSLLCTIATFPIAFMIWYLNIFRGVASRRRDTKTVGRWCSLSYTAALTSFAISMANIVFVIYVVVQMIPSLDDDSERHTLIRYSRISMISALLGCMLYPLYKFSRDPDFYRRNSIPTRGATLSYFDKYIAVAPFITTFQIFALSFVETNPWPRIYDRFMFSHLFSWVNFMFPYTPDSYAYLFWTMSIIVLAWIPAFITATYALFALPNHTPHDIGHRFLIYQHFRKNCPILCIATQLITDSFFVPLTITFGRVVECEYFAEGAILHHSEMTCWGNRHLPMVLVGLLVVQFLIPVSVIFTNLIIADSEGQVYSKPNNLPVSLWSMLEKLSAVIIVCLQLPTYNHEIDNTADNSESHSTQTVLMIAQTLMTVVATIHYQATKILRPLPTDSENSFLLLMQRLSIWTCVAGLVVVVINDRSDLTSLYVLGSGYAILIGMFYFHNGNNTIPKRSTEDDDLRSV